jgi:hypothetical protein
MKNLPERFAGVVLLGVAVLLYDAASGSPVHRLLVPIAMAIAAWLMVQNAAAVLLGAALLTASHSDPLDPDWITGRAYPALAIISGGALGYIAVHRFRGRIASTREARWRHRHR